MKKLEKLRQIMLPESPWYISAAALREYLQIAGLSDDDGGPIWGRAEQQLFAHCSVARNTGGGSTHVRIYRTPRVAVNGRTTRLELHVGMGPRAEGGKPQLIHVRDKGLGDGGSHGRSPEALARRAEKRGHDGISTDSARA